MSEVKTYPPSLLEALKESMDNTDAAQDLVDSLRRQVESLLAQIECYEQALKASWPEGAMGDAFDYWNAARKMQGDKL